jgi:hypothetical protein
VPIAEGIGEALEQQHADAFGPTCAIGLGRERLAAAIGRACAGRIHGDEDARSGHDGDAASESERALALTEGLASEVNGDERRAASGVDAESWADEAEGVGDASGSDTGAGASEEVVLQGIRVGCGVEASGVVIVRDADEDAGGASEERSGVDASELESFPGGLEQEALLWVDGESFARADAEEGRVEAIGIVDETALSDMGVIEEVERPAAVVREGRDGIVGIDEEGPEVAGGAHAAWVAATHGDDGDGVAVGERSREHRSWSVEASEQLRGQKLGESERSRKVEEESGGEGERGSGGDAVPELDGHEGIEAEVAERAQGVERGFGRQAEDESGFGAYELEQELVLLVCGKREETPSERGCGDAGSRSGGGGGMKASTASVGELEEQGPRTRGSEGGSEA